MLPNVRLMIAAMFAAVLMLICGFGMFASFRVSHAPLERVASASSLHLFTAQDAPPPLTVTAAAPFNHRFEIVGPGSRSVSALAYAAPEPVEQPAMKFVAPAVDTPEQNATQPATEPTSPAPESVDVPTQQVPSSEAAPETKPEETLAAATSSGPPADQPTIALVEPSIAAAPEPAQPPAPTEEAAVSFAPPAVEPVRTMPDLTTNAAQKTEKKVKHARTHRFRKPPAVAEASIFATQTTFQTAAGWWAPQEPPKAPAKIPRSKIIAKIPADATYGTGGPFVSVPKQ